MQKIVQNDTSIHDVRYRGVTASDSMVYGGPPSFHISVDYRYSDAPSLAVLIKNARGTIPIEMEDALSIDNVPSMLIPSNLALVMMRSESRSQGLEWMIDILVAAVAVLDIIAGKDCFRFRLTVGDFKTEATLSAHLIEPLLTISESNAASAA